VVNAVMLPRQYDVVVLQQLHHPRQLRVGVGPLVDLVRHRHEDAEREEEAGLMILQQDLIRFGSDEVVRRVAEEHRGQHGVITVRLDPIVAGNRGRIDVVLAEAPDESGADHRDVDRAPRVRGPVDQSREEVGHQNAADEGRY